MGESEKSSPNMPIVLVMFLALLGLATFPQGGGKPSDSAPKTPGDAGPARDARDFTDDANGLGPLATIVADRVQHPSATKPEPCSVTRPPTDFKDPSKDR